MKQKNTEDNVMLNAIKKLKMQSGYGAEKFTDGKEESHCEICKSTKNIVFHHNDYSKPDKVICLCASCHSKVHYLIGDKGDKKKGFKCPKGRTKNKYIREEGLSVIREQMLIRNKMKRMGYKSWINVARELGITKQGVMYHVERQTKKFQEIRDKHLTKTSEGVNIK